MNTIRLGGSRMQEPFGDGYKSKCPICGAEFVCRAGWAYSSSKHRGHGTAYCSYKCFRVWERGEEEKIKRRIAKADARWDGEGERNRQCYERRKQKAQEAREKECVEA